MKTIFLIMIALFLGANFTSCTPTQMAEGISTQATEGDDGEVEDEDDDGTGNNNP